MRAPLTLTLLLLLVFAAPSVRADEKAEQLVRATYKLFHPDSTATCLVIEKKGKDNKIKRYIATAHHVLGNTKGETCLFVSREKKPSGEWFRKDVKIKIRDGEEKLWTKHAKHDLAILELPGDIEMPGLPFECLATEKTMEKVHTGDDVHLAVYPERTEANGAGFPILRSGSIASFPIHPIKIHAVLLVDATSWSGDSGGPIIHKSLSAPGGGPVVIAFVRGLKRVTDKEKESRFEERVRHYPLHVVEALHASFVREMIEKDSGKG